jgi:hypothetical protein
MHLANTKPEFTNLGLQNALSCAVEENVGRI